MKIRKNIYLPLSLSLFSIRQTRITNFLIFLVLVGVIVLMQLDLLFPALAVGFTPDDWAFVFWYKLLGENPFSKFVEVWSIRGPYTTVPLYYTGIIHSLAGFDYQKIQWIGIFLKTLATLILFPLVFIVFKNRLLAFLTTVLFGMSYASSGPLETVVEPSEYLGMFFSAVFIIAYYFTFKNREISIRKMFLSTFLLVVSLMMSVMRVYPLLAIIFLVELYFLLANKSLTGLRIFIFRLGFLFSPLILITLYKPSLILSYIGVLPTVLTRVLEGNLQLLLTPVQGMGHTVPISSRIWDKFGLLKIDSLGEYINFLLNGPFLVFSFIALFLGFFTLKHPKRFILGVIITNLIFEILVFFFVKHGLTVPIVHRVNFDLYKIFPTLFGLFSIITSFFYWIEWRREKNYLFLALWVGPLSSFVFIVLTWLLASENLSFGGAQDHYLMIPSFGTGLFISAILVLIYERMRKSKGILLKISCLLILLITINLFYILNRELIHNYFNRANENGRSASGQILIQSRFRDKTKDVDLSQPALFYFDTSELSQDGPYYTEGLLSPLPFIVRFEGNTLVNGCAEVYYQNKDELKKIIIEQDGRRGFFYRALCVDNGVGGYSTIFYEPDNFYAFKLKNKDLIDIKAEILSELGF